MTDVRETIRSFLTSQRHCVVSSVAADGSPQSALVAFSEMPDLSIVFGTFHDTRKFANICRDPRVSIVVSSDECTVQLDGMAHVATDDVEARCRELHRTKNPRTASYAHHPKQRFIVVRPTWIRRTDHTTETVEELRF